MRRKGLITDRQSILLTLGTTLGVGQLEAGDEVGEEGSDMVKYFCKCANQISWLHLLMENPRLWYIISSMYLACLGLLMEDRNLWSLRHVHL